jgi:tRNA pseudouridine55 synthase
MTKGKVMEGVFGIQSPFPPLKNYRDEDKLLMRLTIAVNKPKMISSAQVIRDLQKVFQPSELFAPWLSMEKAKIDRENHNQRKGRKQKNIQVKIGHGGTLDPLATGVLITGVGKGTKSLQDFLLCTKKYEAVVLFGTSTDSYDRVGKVLRRAPYEHITKDMVEDALKKFRGKFRQLPPLFSALKMNGKPLYEYAREGKPLPREIERRDVEVLELELLEWMDGDTHSHIAPTEDAGRAEINLATNLWKQEGALPPGESPKPSTVEDTENKKRKLNEDEDDLVRERPTSKLKTEGEAGEAGEAEMSGGLPPPAENDTAGDVSELPTKDEPVASKIKGPPAARISMTVTSGFYVRSLCHDLGIEVGSAALMAELERTRQERFEVGKNCLEYEDLQKGEEFWGPKVEAMLDDWYTKQSASTVSSSDAKKVFKTDPDTKDDPDAEKESLSMAA